MLRACCPSPLSGTNDRPAGGACCRRAALAPSRAGPRRWAAESSDVSALGSGQRGEGRCGHRGRGRRAGREQAPAQLPPGHPRANLPASGRVLPGGFGMRTGGRPPSGGQRARCGRGRPLVGRACVRMLTGATSGAGNMQSE
jgi:hypothetical protein